MKDQKIIYQGGASIYLQGLNALEVAPGANEHAHMSFFVGSPESSIQVYDYRASSRNAAENALSGEDEFGFADVFNQSAWVEIKEGNKSTEIVIRDGEENSQNALLWLGVIDDGLMPVQELAWENLRSLDDQRIAFAALIR